MSGATVVGDTKRFIVSLKELRPGTSLEELAAALQLLYPRRTSEQIREALGRLPLLLARSATEEQVRKLSQFLESKGAILKFTYSSPATDSGLQMETSKIPSPISPKTRGQEKAEVSNALQSEKVYSGAERRTKPRVHPGIEIHPMGVGEILDRSFRLLRQHFLLFFFILLIPQATYFLLTKGSQILVRGGLQQGGPLGMGMSFGISFFLAFMVIMILQFWAQGALIHAVSETYLGHKTSWRASYGAMRSRLGRLLGTLFLMGLLLGLLTLVLFFLGSMIIAFVSTVGKWSAIAGVVTVGGIGAAIFFHLFLNWLLVDKVVVLEDKAWLKALSRSTELMKARTQPGFWKSPKNKAGLILLLGLLIGIGFHLLFRLPGLIALMVMPTSLVGHTVKEILEVVATSLAAVYTAIAMILYYYDIRLRSEGFDLKRMAEHL